MNKVLKLRGVSFDWKRAEFKGNNFPEGRQIGLIAQELEREFPELVTTDKEGYKAIAYDRFTAVLLEAIKALQKGQQQQQNQDQEQQNQLQKQQREIENLKLEIAGSTTLLFEAINTLKAQTKEIAHLGAETTSSTTQLLEAANTLKAKLKEIEDLKARISSLEEKVVKERQ